MSLARRFARVPASLLAAALLAACQPLPHPFAGDRPPAALLAVPDNFDISVGEISGQPAAVAGQLPAAIARELLRHNIPASDQTTSRSSFRFEGRLEESAEEHAKPGLTLAWQLRDPTGFTVLRRSEHAPQAGRGRSEDAPVAQLASAAAGSLAALLVDKSAPREAPVGGRTRVAIRKVAGAPGDGDSALAASLTALLKRRDIELVDAATGRPDLAIDGEITVEPTRDNKQHVKIVWRLARGAGGEIGQVAQENDVPRGRLDGAWGDVAYSVAMAAEGGIMQLVARGSPATAAAAAPVPPPRAEAADTPSAANAVAASGPVVRGNIAAPEVNLPTVNVGPDTLPKPLSAPDVPVVLPYRGVPLPPH